MPMIFDLYIVRGQAHYLNWLSYYTPLSAHTAGIKALQYANYQTLEK